MKNYLNFETEVKNLENGNQEKVKIESIISHMTSLSF